MQVLEPDVGFMPSGACNTEGISKLSRATKRTQFFMDLLVARTGCRRVLFLTGTPAMSRPNELWTQVRRSARMQPLSSWGSLARMLPS
jgi:hypothetical protein